MNHPTANKKALRAKRRFLNGHPAPEGEVISVAHQPRPKRAMPRTQITRRDTSTHDLGVALLEPQEHDVICARGGFANNHPGTILFRRLVNDNKELYNNVTTNKGLLSKSIVLAITSPNHKGRFLRKIKEEENEYWSEMEVTKAINKTSQAFRDCDLPTYEPSPKLDIPFKADVNTSHQPHPRSPANEDTQAIGDDSSRVHGVRSESLDMLDDFLSGLFADDSSTCHDLQIVLAERIAADTMRPPISEVTYMELQRGRSKSPQQFV